MTYKIKKMKIYDKNDFDYHNGIPPLIKWWTYNYKGFVYAPSTHAGKIYHTVYKNFRYVMDLSGHTNAVFSKKEFIDQVQKNFLKYRNNA